MIDILVASIRRIFFFQILVASENVASDGHQLCAILANCSIGYAEMPEERIEERSGKTGDSNCENYPVGKREAGEERLK